MQNKRTGKVTLPALGQVGVVVKDLAKAMEYYSTALGIGPWRVMEFDVADLKVRGQSYPWKGRIAFAQLGPVELELIQVLGGRSIHSEFLEEGREGLHHLGFLVTKEEMDHMVAELAREGIGVLQGGKSGIRGGSYAYLDTQGIGGVLFELIHRPGTIMAQS